jgi:glutaconate CoA-transferase subunit B
MAVSAGRMLGVYATCFVGIGSPSLAAMYAKRLIAPNLTLIYESGVIGADPPFAPLSTGSPSLTRKTDMIGSMLDVFGALQAGWIDVGLLSGAQVDLEGNLNSTVIGPYQNPKVRLPGSGGALDIALLAKETLILMPHEPRRFVSRIDFVTSPGRLNPATKRKSLGLGRGPRAIVTDKAVFRFGDSRLELSAMFSDVDETDVLQGFENMRIGRADKIETIALPSEQEIEIVRSCMAQ